MNKELNHPFVDKTKMIQEYLEKGDTISCITRPHKFGMTRNLQMLASFLDLTQDTTAQFQNTFIAQTLSWQQCNQYPVLSLTFHNTKCHSLEPCLYYIKRAIECEVKRYEWILGRTLKSSAYVNYMEMDINAIDVLKILSDELYTIYQRPVHILLDDYDIPMRYAIQYDFEKALWKNFNYQPLIERNRESSIASVLLLGTECLLKRNEGKTYTCMDDDYATAFGYTEEEAQNLCKQANRPWSNDIKDMYGGFSIGSQRVYQPYALNAYVMSGKRVIHSNYRNTSKYLLESLETTDKAVLLTLQALVKTKSILISYQEFTNPHLIWKRLLDYGYISMDGLNKKLCAIRITNIETEVEIQYMIKMLKEST